MYKPGPAEYSFKKNTNKGKKTDIVQLKESDFPEFIPITEKPKDTNKISYAAIINPVKEVPKPDEPPVETKGRRRVVVRDMPDKEEDEIMNKFIELQMPDLTEYYKRRDKRLKDEEQRRRQRPYDSLSEEEIAPEDDDDSEIFAPEEEEVIDNAEEYDPSEFDRHR